MIRHWRAMLLGLGLLAPLAVLLWLPPIGQDPAYHTLADARACLGVPNCFDVLSNAAFLAAGGCGLTLCLRRPLPGVSVSWKVFFGAVVLVGFGSGWYHLAPDDDALLWDRLPMTIAFMAAFAALLNEHTGARERITLPAAIAVGIGSIAWWQYADDLRLYAWVQLAPLVAIVLLLAAYPARYTHRAWLAYALIFYALAKVAEAGDHAIYAYTEGAISGHTLKHLLAAMAPLCIALMLAARKPAVT